MCLGEARSVAEYAFNLRDIGATGLGVKDQGRKNARPGAAAFYSSDKDSVRRLSGAGMNRENRDVAEPARHRRQKCLEPIGTEDDDEAPVRFQDRSGGAEPWFQAAVGEDMSGSSRLPRRRSPFLPLMEWRIHDERIGNGTSETRGYAFRFRRGKVCRDNRDAACESAIGQPGKRFSCACDGLRIALYEDRGNAPAARRDSHAGDTDARAEINHSSGESRFDGGGQKYGFQTRPMVAMLRLHGLHLAA
jgi:hypothetical protein